jgi:AraC family transcriptional regulator, transcriptional activator of the genes for pyochelin and ferripyochelin receptors
MKLITYKIDQIIQSKPVKGKIPGLKKDEYNRIKKAAEILTDNLENPPGLFNPAKNVGTTHTRLNQGFRQIYDTTAFGYLRQVRLEKAR